MGVTNLHCLQPVFVFGALAFLWRTGFRIKRPAPGSLTYNRVTHCSQREPASSETRAANVPWLSSERRRPDPMSFCSFSAATSVCIYRRVFRGLLLDLCVSSNHGSLGVRYYAMHARPCDKQTYKSPRTVSGVSPIRPIAARAVRITSLGQIWWRILSKHWSQKRLMILVQLEYSNA